MNSHNKTKPSLLLFFPTYLLALWVLTLNMPALADLPWMAANDDAMRLVQVRDFMAGQGWADLMQYRLGPDGGTLMHWSRLVDVPIAGLIWGFSNFMPTSSAEAVTMIVWPFILAGLFLWLMQKASIAFGGKQAQMPALIFSFLALIASGKFIPSALDHHNLQLVIMAFVLWAMMSERKAVLAGFGCAVGIAIGLEVLLFVAATCLFVGLRWIWAGVVSRAETLGFSGSFGAGLVLIYLTTQPDFTATMLACDAMGFDVTLLGAIGGFGLLAIAAVGSKLPLMLRAILGLGLIAIIFMAAKTYAPACLSNPMDQLHPDVIKYWLSLVSEAQGLLASIKSSSRDAGLLLVPAIALIYIAILSREGQIRSRAAFLALAIVISWVMTFYQIRGQFFLLLLCILPISAMIGLLYKGYKSTGSGRDGMLVIWAMLISIPNVWVTLYETISKTAEPTVIASKPVGLLSDCFAPNATNTLAGLPAGLILSSPNMGAGLLNVTEHRLLRSNFHRNQDGILAGLNVAFAKPDVVENMLHELGVDYMVYCQNDQRLMIIGGDDNSIWQRIFRGDPPDYLTQKSASPDDMLQIYAVSPKQEP